MQNHSFQLLDQREYDVGPCYTIILGLGIVRYLSVKNFLDSDAEEVITYLRSQSENPQVSPPWEEIGSKELTGVVDQRPGVHWDQILELKELNVFLEGESWDTKIRIHHILGRMFISDGMPSWVYCCFHRYLRLSAFASDECLKAWVQESLANKDIIDSYRNSINHLIVADKGVRGTRWTVFNKTPFVSDRLNALAQESTRLAREQQYEEARKRAAVDVELLRKSKFESFVYLMEDSRNGTFKIGRSRTPGKRERTLQSEIPQVILRFSIPAEEAHERELQDRFQSKRLRGEWFALAKDDLAWIVSFLKTNGDTSRVFVDYFWLGKVHFEAGSEGQTH